MQVRFGTVTLDADAMELERDGERVAVEPQVMEVLSYLVAHRERLVPKTELLDEIWGDRFVSESALSSRIKSARQVIGDNGRDQRLIRTIHGRGFRFVAEVDEVGDPRPRSRHAVPTSTPPSLRTPDWQDVLERTVQGNGGAFEIVGSAPAGREVVDELRSCAYTLGITVCEGRGADELRPYASVLQAIDELVAQRPLLTQELPPPYRAELDTALAGSLPEPRRLLLAVRELVTIAGRAGGLVLMVEDAHLVDQATLELLQHLARGTSRNAVLVVITLRQGTAGRPFERLELPAASRAIEDIPLAIRSSLERIAALGDSVPFDEALAAVGLPLADGQRVLDLAQRAGVLERSGHVLEFTDATTLEQVRSAAPPALRVDVRRSVADALIRQNAAPGRIASLLVAAGDVQAAAPHLLSAAEAAAADQRHADVLANTVLAAAVQDREICRSLLELRGDALAALGDLGAARCYRDAVATAGAEATPWLRARLARSLIAVNNLDSARAVMAEVDVAASDHPGVRLVAATVLLLEGELEQAESLIDGLENIALTPGAPAQMLDVITVQGMIAHSRGEWFDRLRVELRMLGTSGDVIRTFLDAHLCVAQYLLYGPTGHEEVIALARQLRQSAQDAGVEPATAFASTLEGEAMLLSGDLDGARACLEGAVATYRRIGADTGLAHALQRLAEVHLHAGDRAECVRLLHQALPMARWSPLSKHLLQRSYGTLIAAAATPAEAATVADDAFAILDGPTACDFCHVMVAVPAAMAYAAVGRLDDAAEQLDIAAQGAERWDGMAWPAAVMEARAALARAEGRDEDASDWLQRAARGFDEARQPLDAARCREAD